MKMRDALHLVFVWIALAVVVAVGIHVYRWHLSPEISDQMYREISRDLLSAGDSADPVYGEARDLMERRVSEFMGDGSITEYELAVLYEERADYVAKARYRNAKRELQDRLSSGE